MYNEMRKYMDILNEYDNPHGGYLLNKLMETTLPSDIEEKFGRVLFGDFLRKRGSDNNEPDTKYEKAIFSFVWAWFKGYHHRDDVQAKIQELSQMKDNYPTLLKPDPASKAPVLYRTIYSDQGTQELDRQIYDNSIAKDTGQLLQLAKPITYTPKRLAESWSSSLESIIEISEHYRYHKGMGKFPENYIIGAKIPDNERLFKTDFTNAVYDATKHGLFDQDEIMNEVIRVSDRPIQGTVYVMKDNPIVKRIGHEST